MSTTKVPDESSARLQKFAELYQKKMEQHPFMEIIVRYDSMTEAGLTVAERIKSDLYIETNRFDELLRPGENSAELRSVK